MKCCFDSFELLWFYSSLLAAVAGQLNQVYGPWSAREMIAYGRRNEPPVLYRTPSTTTTRTTTITTKPPPTTTTTTTAPNKTICTYLTEQELLEMMRKQGIFNYQFMATDIESAASTFPDLTDTEISADTSDGCDKGCRQSRQQVLRPINSRPSASENYAQAYHTHGRRFYSNYFGPSPETRNRPGSVLTVNSESAIRVRRRLRSRQKRQVHSMLPEASSEVSSSTLSSHEKFKRVTENTTVIGSSYPLSCTESGDEGEDGYHKLCGSCRAVRELPEQYFPKYLNEVVCLQGDCLKGHGRCLQKFLPFSILSNAGTSSCHQWRKVTIWLRVSCECLISNTSVLFMTFVH